jgi:hypothetical protein
MKDKTKIIGLLGVGVVGYYFYMTRDKDVATHRIEGLNINVNPEKLLDSGLALLDGNPYLKQQVSTSLKGFLKGYLNKKK